MGKIFVKYIGKENIQIADNTWKRFPISSVINEKQIKTTMKWHYTSFKWLWLNKDRKIISSGQCVEQLDLPHTAGENYNGRGKS